MAATSTGNPMPAEDQDHSPGLGAGPSGIGRHGPTPPIMRLAPLTCPDGPGEDQPPRRISGIRFLIEDRGNQPGNRGHGESPSRSLVVAGTHSRVFRVLFAVRTPDIRCISPGYRPSVVQADDARAARGARCATTNPRAQTRWRPIVRPRVWSRVILSKVGACSATASYCSTTPVSCCPTAASSHRTALPITFSPRSASGTSRASCTAPQAKGRASSGFRSPDPGRATLALLTSTPGRLDDAAP